MSRALRLAAQAKGQTSPNPMVGCVIVKDGRVVGEGYHRKAGQDHAEVEALKSLHVDPLGATMYVTLEPCCHYGRTPPCTESILEAGIGRVVYAVGDPNPKVAGGGAEILRQAGVTVDCGLLENEARDLNRAFFHAIKALRSFVTVKTAMSLDGKIATHTGESQWITGSEAREWVHQLRSEVDAVLVGSGTVMADNPSLTVRLAGDHNPQPLAIIADSRARVSLEARVFERTREVIWAVAADTDTYLVDAAEALGVQVWLFEPDGNGSIPIDRLLERTFQAGLNHILCEAGGTLVDSLMRSKSANEIWAFIAPLIIGSREAPSVCSGTGYAHLKDAPRLEWIDGLRVGPDWCLKARVLNGSV